MHPTSPAQSAASGAGSVPPPERVRDGLWALPLAMPVAQNPYTLAYLFLSASGGAHVVDPGVDTESNWMLLERTLALAGSSVAAVESITVTHLHPDHLGMAARLRAASGAPVAVHRAEQAAIDSLAAPRSQDSGDALLDAWGVPAGSRDGLAAEPGSAPALPPFTADRLLDDGDLLPLGGHTLRVLHTPGHTSGHIVLQDAGARLLLTGDHVLPTINPGLGLGGPTAGNAMADYLVSLDRVRTFDDHEVLPGHEYRFTGLAARCDALAAHHLRRAREVEAIVASRADATVWQVAERVTWSGGWQNLRGFYRRSALAQTAMHREFAASDAGRERIAAAKLEP